MVLEALVLPVAGLVFFEWVMGGVYWLGKPGMRIDRVIFKHQGG